MPAKSGLSGVILTGLLALAAIRLFLTVNLPLILLVEGVHDDGLYMRLGLSLASGHWLGEFNQFTLMKGPGYPAFLALTNLSGLPVSLTHGLFHLLAVSTAAWAVLRLTGSRPAALITFVVLVLHPWAFVPEMQRIIRGQIYWGQALLVVALFAVLLYAPPRRTRSAIAFSVLAGICLGWAWLTREEGIWFLPGLAVLGVGAFILKDSASERWVLARNAAIAVAAFVVVNVAFMLGNLAVYGSFVGVDVKERNFKAALATLQSVDVPIVPYVPVPLSAREQIAKVSPTFQPLNVNLAPGGAQFGWSYFGCLYYPATCDDIAAGWFLWALRDAAADHGFYKSPEATHDNFGRLASEIRAACANGKLRCRLSWSSYMPAITPQQWAAVPSTVLDAASLALFVGAPDLAEHGPAAARAEQRTFWAFLNFPQIATSEDMRLRGWYWDSDTAQWPTFKLYNATGEETSFSLTRRRSPDLQKHFADERPGFNRFEILTQCAGDCILAAVRGDGADLRLKLDQSPQAIAKGNAQLYLDELNASFYHAGPARTVALALRSGLVDVYRVLAPVLILAGLAAFIGACAKAVRWRFIEPVLLVAMSLWVFVATYITILALIDISSFPALSYQYMVPAAYLAIFAAMVSLTAFWNSPKQPGAS